MPVSRLQREFSVDEFLELQVFCDKFEPFGDVWRMVAFIATVLINTNPYCEKAVSVEEMLRTARGIPEPLPTEEELGTKIHAILGRWCR